MPKFPKGFGRRKSTANALEELQNAPVSAESSFKVLERPGHNKNSSFDGGIKLAKGLDRPSTSPMQRREDNMFAGMNRDRDSGGSNSNTTSTFTTDNSSRFSAASTAPSTQNSDESHRQDERVSHPDRTYDIPASKLPRASPAFSLKAAGRTFSFGRGKGTPPPLKEEILPPPIPIIEYENMGAGRSRGTTTSSHASTATPPKLDEQDLGLNLGGTFSSDMFTNFKRKSTVMPSNEEISASLSNTHDTAEPAKPLPAYSNLRSNQPPPLNIDRSRNIEPSQYSWASSHESGRRLIGATPSPPPIAHMNAPPPVPRHGVPYDTHDRDNYASHARPQRPGGPSDSGLRRSSAFSVKRRSTFETGDAIDEDAKLLQDSINASRQLSSPSTENRRNEYRAESSEATPKQKLHRLPSVSSHDDSEDMFDPSIAENAVLANQLSEQALSPTPSLKATTKPRNKIMTPAQFERAKQDHERALISGGLSKDEDDEDAYDEDEDEAERLKEIAKQRKMQDAHMAVFRQGMMKSTGEMASPLPSRPNIMSSHSAPNLLAGGKAIADDSDSDEEVPLAILQAHGFPNKNRPPSHLANLNMGNSFQAGSQVGANPGPSSNSGSAMGGGGGNLPVFARNLPQDPYFGASVVNPLNRESLAFGSATGSSRGGGFRGQGLVGVIANEERARAMRRGSPSAGMNAGVDFASNGMNHTGFGAMGMGIPPNMNPQMHQPMMNPIGPMAMGPMGPMMNPMMAPQMMPGMGIAPNQTQQDQMDFMRMQMQMQQMQQMQFMQMMNAGVPPGSASGQQRTSTMTGTGPPVLQVPGLGQRPQSSGRTMSLMDPNVAPWHSPMPNYTPSIAPSERSNIGLPGRYRPVSQAAMGVENNHLNINKSRTPSPSNLGVGGVQNRWSNGTASKGPSSLATTATTIKPSVKVVVQREEKEEDEEAGWAAMKAKREKKRGFWKEKKADDEIKGMLGHFA